MGLRRSVSGVVIALIGTGAVWAEEAEPDVRSMAERFGYDGGSFSFVWENDIFGGTDQDYTNGVQFHVTSGPRSFLPGTKPFSNVVPNQLSDGYSSWRTGYTLGHAIFTPQDISLEDPDPADRPYAGYLYGSLTFYGEKVGHRPNPSARRLDTARVTVGVVGDAAQGERVQSGFHQAIDGQDPSGWRFQLKNEPILQFRFESQGRRAITELGPIELDGSMYNGVALGNAEVSAQTGVVFRVGQHLTGDYGPPRVRPALGGVSFFETGESRFGWYVFAGADVRGVAHNIFLDGNTFQDSRSVDREPFVVDGQAGLVLRLGKVRTSFTFVHRTEEFGVQRGVTRFGAGTLSFRF